MLLAGGGGTRLGVLVKQRAKPAVPFAGNYRIIDFALSNVMHAGLDWVGVLTQYKPLSLMRHLGVGGAWNLRGRRRGVHILPPRTGEDAADWYRGTADAIWQNFEFMRNMKPERVLILSGDHIYRMDYRRMLDEHLQAKADLSIALMEVAPEDVSRFGMVWTDEKGQITRFEEKPDRADTSLASMGIYLFEWDCLAEALHEIVATRQGFDFGFDIMAQLLATRRVMAHRFCGYWRDVGTVASYFAANMDLLDPASGFDLDRWEICTRDDDGPEGDRPPTRMGRQADCRRCLISPACVVDGQVTDSILSPEVRIGAGAVVEHSILMDGVIVEPGARVVRAVIDKGALIGAGASILGGRTEVTNPRFAKCQLDGLTVIGKSACIPGGLQVGSSVVIDAGIRAAALTEDLPDGAAVLASES
jgi:glucose-1-phosphate adenylyltransferase